MTSRSFRLLVATTALVASLVSSPPAEATRGGLGLYESFHMWVATMGSRDRSVTSDQAKKIAQRFDVGVGMGAAFTEHVALVRAVNPKIRFIVYMNGTFSRPQENYPDSMYAHDARGRKIFSTKWGNYLMEPTNSGWIKAVSDECRDNARAARFDGCYLDMLGLGPFTDGYLSATPINPRTGDPWTPGQYVQATARLAAQVKKASPGLYVVGNGISNGKKYYDGAAATSVLLDGIDGGNAEGWIRGATQGVNQFRPEDEWRKDVDMLIDAGKSHKAVITMTKVWVNATSAEINRWHKYALASFLLGNDGHAFFSFYSDRDRQSIEEASTPQPLDKVDIGNPVEAYSKRDGYYRRAYHQDVAAVNPTGAPAVVRFDRPNVNLSGERGQVFTLPSHTGDVYRQT